MDCAGLSVSEVMREILQRRFPQVPPHTLTLRVGEFLKFLMLAARSDAAKLPISGEIDEIWHAFILETQEYAALCRQAGNFVHHTAKRAVVTEDPLRQLDDDLSFVVAYVDKFGAFAQSVIPLWPAIGRLTSHLGVDVRGLMAFARDLLEQQHVVGTRTSRQHLPE